MSGMILIFWIFAVIATIVTDGTTGTILAVGQMILLALFYVSTQLDEIKKRLYK